MAGQYVTNEEEWLSVKNGRKILTLINKVPLHNLKGRVIGVLGVATDITEKKRLEAIRCTHFVITRNAEYVVPALPNYPKISAYQAGI